MKDQILKYFMELVKIDSESRNERDLADYLDKELRDLGGELLEDDAAEKTAGNAGNIIAWFPGDEDIEPLLINAHMDTVKPGNGIIPVIDEGRIISEGNTILGADDKSGIAMILAYLKKRKGEKHKVPLQLIFTVCEEIGLLGAKALDVRLLKAKRGYSLDGNLLGQVVKASPTQITYDIKVIGKSVHAGIEPEKGLNAIKAAADLIESLPDGRINEHTTMNLGRICGGKATNIVCDEVHIEGEIRSHSKADLEYCLHQVKACAEKVRFTWNTEVEVHHSYSFKALQFDEEEDLIAISRQAFENIGMKQELMINGGGSDANALAENGIRLAVIGTGMQKIHTTDEFIMIEDLVNGYKWLKNVIDIWEKQCRN